jgi:hypothetical protein
MSVDYHNVCPACVSKKLGKPIAEISCSEYNKNDEDYGMGVYQQPIYFDKGYAVVEFDGRCDCGYTMVFTHKEPLSDV